MATAKTLNLVGIAIFREKDAKERRSAPSRGERRIIQSRSPRGHTIGGPKDITHTQDGLNRRAKEGGSSAYNYVNLKLAYVRFANLRRFHALLKHEV
jgi:hypothetical protein